MYARVTTFHAQPGRVDEGIRLFEALAEQLKDLKGFVSTQLLVDRTANMAMTMTLYETLTDLEASRSGFQEAQANLGVVAILVGPPVAAVYEVAARVAARP